MAQAKIEQVSPTVFIGLGGTGAIAVHLLRQKLGDVPVVRFLVIDSDPRSRVMEERKSYLNDEEYLHIGVNMRIRDLIRDLPLLDEHQRESVNSWFPDPPNPRYANSLDTLQEQAKQVRPLGRLALFYNAQSIYNKIIHALTYVQNSDVIEKSKDLGYTVNEQPDQRRVFIISSLGGGQGSANFIDVAYMTAKAVKRITKEVVRINGILLLPSIFVGNETIQAPAAHANSYAALKELDYFMKSKKFKAYYYGGGDGEIGLEEQPFWHVYLISGRSPRGLIGLSGATQMISEVLFSYMPIVSSSREQFKNYIDEDIQSEGHYCASFGYRMIKLSRDRILAYFRSRLAEKLCEKILDEPSANVDNAVANFFDPNFRLNKLKEKITFLSVGEPERFFAKRDWKRVLPNVEKVEKKASNGVDQSKKGLRENCDKQKQELEKEINKKIQDILDNPEYGIKFALNFIRKLRDELNLTGGDIKKVLRIEEDGKPGLESQRNNYIGDNGTNEQYRGELQKTIEGSSMIGWPLGNKQSAQHYIDRFRKSIKEHADLEIRIYQLEEIEKLLREIDVLLEGLHQKWSKADRMIGELQSEFYREKRRAKDDILRGGEPFFSEKVEFNEEGLKQMANEVNPDEKVKDLITQNGGFFNPKEIEGKDDDKEKFYQKLRAFCEDKFKDWEEKSVVNILDKRGKVEEKIRYLHDGAFAFWDPRIDIRRTNVTHTIEGIAVAWDEVEKVQECVHKIGGGIAIAGTSQKEVLSLSYLEYGAPLKEIREVDETCKSDYDREKNNRDLHVFAPFSKEGETTT